MKQLIIKLLQNRARSVLIKFKPTIIAITGSVGKTSAKQAIRLVLEDTHSIRYGAKNYNNEFGVPLTILGEKSPGKSIIGWLKLFMRSMSIKEYPDVLILEFGIDHPGDMKALCELAQPDVSIVTGISPIHAEFFKDIDDLAKEKGIIVERTKKDGLVILNGDDERVRKMAERSVAPVVTYGTDKNSISAKEINIASRIDESFEPGEQFVRTTAEVLEDDVSVGQLKLINVIGYAPVMACLAGIAVGRYFNDPITSSIERLNRKMKPVPGRLNPIAGIKGSLIIDDTYNAAPAAMKNGLEILRMFNPGEEYDRRIVALGAMLELGKYNDDEHRLIGLKVAEFVDLFIAVGENMKIAIEAAKEAGMDPEHIEWFENSELAGRYLDKIIKQGDIVYVKGAQSTRMEKLVKDVMAEPLRAGELLVRQDQGWI